MADNVISSVSYTYDSYFLQLAQKYFNISDISTAKAGLFGYITNMGSHIAKNSTFHRNMLYNEFFLNTAVMQDSVINWAKILNYNINMSIPSSCKVNLKLDMQAILSDNTVPYIVKDDYYVYTIHKDQIFQIDTFNFLLPYEVEIYAKYTGQLLNVYAKYKKNPTYSNYEDSAITSDELKILIEGNYANIILDIYQLEKNVVVYDILSTDILQSSIFDVNFTNNLSTFKVEYQSANDKINNIDFWNNLTTVFSEVDTPLTTFYCYYNLVSDTILRIYFSTIAGSFKPEFNSKVRVTTYTSLGEAGNFTYSGNVALLNSPFNKIGYSCVNLVDPSNGTNQLDFLNTKKTLMNALRTRNSYTTESDINSFFSQVSLDKFNSKISVETVKIRDDIINRVYTLYTLLRLSDNSIVPTNTIDLDIPINVIEKMNFVIKPGTFVIYDRINSIFRLLDENELPDSYLYNNDSYIYVIPYLLNFDFKQFPKINSYITNYSQDFSVTLDATKINPNFYSTLNINYATISRNVIFDTDNYLLEVPVLGNLSDLNTIALVLVLYDGITPVAECRLSLLPSSNKFYKRLFTNDDFSIDGAYIISNSFFSYGTENLINELKIGKNLDAVIQVYDNRPSNLYTGTISSTLLTSFKFNDKIGFAESINENLNIHLDINPNKGSVVLNKIPLISANTFFNTKYNSDIFNSLYKLFNETKNVSNLLENNINIDLKFFNTYGMSSNYTIDTTDIKIHIQMKLNIGYTDKFQADLVLDIANFIEQKNYTLDRRFSLSNLITYLEKKYIEIDYIKTFTINNANIQNIEYIESSKTANNVNYIPEVISVRKLNKVDYYGNDFTYDITIDFL